MTNSIWGDRVAYLPDPESSAIRTLSCCEPLPSYTDRYRGDVPDYLPFLIYHRSDELFWHFEPPQYVSTPQELHEKILEGEASSERNIVIGTPLAGGIAQPDRLDFTLVNVSQDEIRELIVRAFATKRKINAYVKVSFSHFKDAHIYFRNIDSQWGIVSALVGEYGYRLAS